MKEEKEKIFEKVVVVGPDWTGCGGIASVLHTYHDTMKGLRFRKTNSQNGRLVGFLELSRTMVYLIFDRLSGRRIVHIHFASGKSWIRKRMLMKYARMLGFRVVSHCHSCNIDNYVAAHGADTFTKELKKAKVNIVLSSFWKRFFDTTICCGNVETLNNIVGQPAAVERNRRNKIPTFLFLGFLGDRKGIFEILEAAARLKADGRRFRIIVGGNGELNRFQERVEQLGLGDVVDYRGWIAGEQKDQLLATADVLMLPSYAEGLPISVLEGMANGLAIISTPVGGIPDVLHDGENGIMVEPGNVDQIAEAMEQYITDPELSRRHGDRSLEIVKPYYAPAVRERLKELYALALKD